MGMLGTQGTTWFRVTLSHTPHRVFPFLLFLAVRCFEGLGWNQAISNTSRKKVPFPIPYRSPCDGRRPGAAKWLQWGGSFSALIIVRLTLKACKEGKPRRFNCT